MGVSDDLQYLVLAAGEGDPGGPWGTVTPTEVARSRSARTVPSSPSSAPPGRITIRDWTSVGVEPYATATAEQRFGSPTVVSLDGDVIDLTEALRRLGFSNGFNWAWTASESGQVAITTHSTIEI